MVELNLDQKLGGVLAPVFALRGEEDLGIGDTRALEELVEWAASIGFHIVQILPVNEPGMDNSPYNVISSMALDPLTIATTPSAIPDLSDEDFARITGTVDLGHLRTGSVKYAEVRDLKRRLLKAAFETFDELPPESDRKDAFLQFSDEQYDWLQDYTLYRALMDHNLGHEILSMWPDAHRSPEKARHWLDSQEDDAQIAFRREQEFYAYVQWIAFSQWCALRDRCDELGVVLIGDVPVGVSIYSCDVWAEPHIFDLTRSSGAPPEKAFKSDLFTEKWGQNWGFPLYDWYAMSHDNFAWWRRRLRAQLAIFHVIRIDHALGFFRIYSFPWRPEQNSAFAELTHEEAMQKTGGPLPGFVPRDDSTEENREANRRHGETLFRILLEETGPNRIIAEDLGEVAPYVRPTLKALGIPGFKIPQWERDDNDKLIPGGLYDRVSLATYATHDHPPIAHFWTDWHTAAQSGNPEEAERALAQMRELLDFAGGKELSLPRPFDAEIHRILLAGLFATNSWLAVHMITDIFGLKDRFNVPGLSAGDNWAARLPESVSSFSAKYPEILHFIQENLVASERVRV